MPSTKMLGMIEGAGGLFDFNGTLPLMAIQFILLTVTLTFVFYKPIAKVIDEREAYITENLTTASNSLIKAEKLYQKYDERLKTTRVLAQRIVAKSEKETKQEVLETIESARIKTANLINQTKSLLEKLESTITSEEKQQISVLKKAVPNYANLVNGEKRTNSNNPSDIVIDAEVISEE